MENLIENLEQLTKSIVDNLDSATYEQLEDFVQRRGEIIATLKTIPFSKISTNSYREQIQSILKYDSIIVARMEELRQEANERLTKISIGRQQKVGYEAVGPYDSVFFDQKK
nr:flagellar protein FliT [Aneurinibacillus sp. XH2]